ncbi:glucoamylase family protein [Arachidicoccus soli]|uniref:Beta-glucosidase n=1 Tax=Arachidicoccus soli TaxID=2341117 RepID=A0A386HSC1_9BACT|nr:glucoamylase family protein [Arachidicoccus soli]AYD48765.1 beta-glucosidase [Arachidicoccus soli]
MKNLIILFFSLTLWGACKKGSESPNPTGPSQPTSFDLSSFKVNGTYGGFIYYNVNMTPTIQASFFAPIDETSAINSISLIDAISGATIPISLSFQNGDSSINIRPNNALPALTKFTFTVSGGLESKSKVKIQSPVSASLYTEIDSTAKFPQISDSALLDLVQKQTLKYFWDFGHPISGMARERNTSGDVVTTGGTGFGIMAMIVGVKRGFITRSDAVTRINTIVNFLITKCTRWHGAFSHWINGTTGATIAFGNNNGADIVETSFLMEGLLCARQYFNNIAVANENALKDSINSIWNAIDWNWFTQNDTQNALYWQYNPSYTSTNDIWSIKISGWNEALIAYILGASSSTHSIAEIVYDNGWANMGALKNGNTFYNIMLPLGPNLGGPLFFEHYSFMGLNPEILKDAYADYNLQTKNHTLINRAYCIANPNNNYGYSNLCWGLTASDIQNGYNASSPTNDVGVIAPTAAISSMPYTPTESLAALKFFYYQLGDKIWGQYGFVDAFSLKDLWFASSYLAIDQGPEIVMVENYRSGLLWSLFMSCPEIRQGLTKLGFTY